MRRLYFLFFELIHTIWGYPWEESIFQNENPRRWVGEGRSVCANPVFATCVCDVIGVLYVLFVLCFRCSLCVWCFVLCA